MPSRLKTAILASSLLSACYVEEPQERKLVETDSASECRYTDKTGCLNAVVAAAPDIAVDGMVYQDAETLSRSFEALVKPFVVVKNTAPTSSVEIQVQLATAFDNKSFLQDFELHLVAERDAVSKDLIRGGRARIHELKPDTYVVQAQRPVKFIITKVEKASVDAAPISAKALFCGQFVARNEVDILAKKRADLVIRDFAFRFDPKPCGDGDEVTLQPQNANGGQQGQDPIVI